MNDNKIECMKVAKKFVKNIGMVIEDLAMEDINFYLGDGSL